MGSAIAPTPASGFAVGVQDSGFGQSTNAPSLYHVLHAVDGAWVRQALPWSFVAPRGNTSPSEFDASNPADPHYDWSQIDTVVRSAAAKGARLILNPYLAPTWAEGPNRPGNSNIGSGAWDPNPADFGAFMRAAAVRYSGQFPDPLAPGAFLPRVKYWEIWNEENLPIRLAAPDLVGEYRALLDAAYHSIKAVNPSNVVSIGGTAPVSFLAPYSISPLAFDAELMCLRRVRTSFVRIKPCPKRISFDVLSHHPYSLAASPTKHAYHYNDVLVGDMGKLRRLLQIADKLHTVLPNEHHGLWVTEWSWFSNPPNTIIGDTPNVAARYTAYSIYEMWKAGVSVLIWVQIMDPTVSQTAPSFVTGGALYTHAGKPKLMMRAFAFPFVAGVAPGRGFAWGRAPVPGHRLVTIQRRQGRKWVRVVKTRTKGDGTFYCRFRAGGNGNYRAVMAHGPKSLVYNSKPIPPRRTHAFYSG